MHALGEWGEPFQTADMSHFYNISGSVKGEKDKWK